jgi:hypothetical protein
MNNTHMPDLIASIMQLAVTNAQATLQFLLGQDGDGSPARPGQQPPAAAAVVRGAVASAAFAAAAAASPAAAADSSRESDSDEDGDSAAEVTVAAAMDTEDGSVVSSSSSLSTRQNTLTILRCELELQLKRAQENDTTGARQKLADLARGMLGFSRKSGQAQPPKPKRRIPALVKNMMENLRHDHEKVRGTSQTAFATD